MLFGIVLLTGGLGGLHSARATTPEAIPEIPVAPLCAPADSVLGADEVEALFAAEPQAPDDLVLCGEDAEASVGFEVLAPGMDAQPAVSQPAAVANPVEACFRKHARCWAGKKGYGCPYQAHAQDCPGFATYLVRKCLGLEVGGSSRELWSRGKRVGTGSLKSGDLCFFGGPDHHLEVVVLVDDKPWLLEASCRQDGMRFHPLERLDNLKGCRRLE